jgi:glycine cleavage system H protein
MARPDNARYTESHEWAVLKDGVLTLGITDHAVEAHGDIVYIDLPEQGHSVDQGDSAVEIESVKAVGEVYAPVSGTIVAVNEGLADDPSPLASDPFGAGWLVRIRVEDDSGFEAMLDRDAYDALLEGAE